MKQEKGESIQRYGLRLSTKAKELRVPTENNSVVSSAFLAGLENNKVREGIIDRKELNAPLKEWINLAVEKESKLPSTKRTATTTTSTLAAVTDIQTQQQLEYMEKEIKELRKQVEETKNRPPFYCDHHGKNFNHDTVDCRRPPPGTSFRGRGGAPFQRGQRGDR